MTRIKRGTTAHKRRKNILKRAKGFDNRRSTNLAPAREALLHAEKYAYRDRRNKKRDFRSLWIARINAAARQEGTTYSQLIASLQKSDITLNRKMLAEIAAREPQAFSAIVRATTKAK